MKEFYIADALRFENQVVTSSFVVISKQAKPKKNGEPYLALTSVIALAISMPRCGTTSWKPLECLSRMTSSRSGG